jgi:hypothetical protein
VRQSQFWVRDTVPASGSRQRRSLPPHLSEFSTAESMVQTRLMRSRDAGGVQGVSQGRGKAEGRIGGVDKRTTHLPSLHLHVHTHSMLPMTTAEGQMNADAALAEHGTPVAAFRLRLHPKRTRSCPSTPSCPHPHNTAPPQPARTPPLLPTTVSLQLSKGRSAAPVVGLRAREECVPAPPTPPLPPARPPLSPRFAPCPNCSQRSLHTVSRVCSRLLLQPPRRRGTRRGKDGRSGHRSHDYRLAQSTTPTLFRP